MNSFGEHIRFKRERLNKEDKSFSLRKTAVRIDVQPTYLSKVERGEVPPPSEATIKRLAKDIDEDPDVILAMAGKVSKDLIEIITKRPRLFADLIRKLKEAPDEAVFRVVREVADGDW
jgi:transcriptional regulator with XRE-family HTH domain